MMKFLLAAVLVLAGAAVAEASHRPFFPRLHRQGPCQSRFAPAPAIPLALSHPFQFAGQVVQATAQDVRQLPQAIRNLTLLPSSSGGCGPNGCPKLPAGLPR